ncbi:MAG TPA: 20S proteasome subunit A/B [Methylomirabilota bacterium]|nr:20S proteasome subunit A/B [Methylomirabilota bacterium]
MTEEPYRWLEAIGNRREYIREQLKGGTPVFALSRPEGVFLVGVGHGQSKVFEIYDRHAFAALGHPVDIEKVRQAAIEAAHMEGFNRSPGDVTLRRLVNFALSPTLKNSFEQIFSPPLMVESIFAEVGETRKEDLLVRVHFDGHHRYERAGVAVAHVKPETEAQARDWLERVLREDDPLPRVFAACLTAYDALVNDKPVSELEPVEPAADGIPDKTIEAALLDRRQGGNVRYRPLEPGTLRG